MTKKLIAGVLVATLLLPGSAALTGKKKKKGPKPWTSEELTIALAHPVFYGQSGDVMSVTARGAVAQLTTVVVVGARA